MEETSPRQQQHVQSYGVVSGERDHGSQSVQGHQNAGAIPTDKVSLDIVDDAILGNCTFFMVS